MSPVVVADASAIVALLVDAGPDGQWAAEMLGAATMVAPALLPFEVANILRRLELAKIISTDQAVQAHADLLALPIEFWPHELLATRMWQLRPNLTAYDAAYVALAETLDVAVVTLDRKIARATGPRCAVRTP